MAGIWNVGTRYKFRRQRIATTLMSALLDDLYRRGCTTSTLMASASGLHLYEQLGYRQIGVTAYMAPPYFRAY
jgi:predicted acetyltransferase